MQSVRVADVAIVGGGPAGLASALSLKAAMPSAKCIVFEKASALREVGSSVALFANAMKALKAINTQAYQSVVKGGFCPNRRRQVSLAGAIVADVDSSGQYKEWQDKYGEPSMQVSWYDLQRWLADELPADSLQLGHGFEGYEEEEEGVLVHFRNKPPVRAKLLVGADGNQSAVRTACLGSAVQPTEYTGRLLYRTLLPLSALPSDLVSADAVTSLFDPASPGVGGALMVSLGKNRIAIHMAVPSAPDQIQAVRQQQLAAAQAREAGGAGPQHQDYQRYKMERMLAAVHTAPSWFRDALAAVDPLLVNEHIEYRRAAGDEWGRGRVTLVGDAAHLTPPVHAQGTAMALEDAAALGHAVAELGITPDALRRYEVSRMPRIRQMQDYERAHPSQYMDAAQRDVVFGVQVEPVRARGLQGVPVTAV